MMNHPISTVSDSFLFRCVVVSWRRGVTSICALLLLPFLLVAGESPLAPIKTDHPRDTMKSFLVAMDQVREAYATGGDPRRWLEDAARTLDLSDVPAVERAREGRQAAIHLKEVIDRVIVVDLSKVPDEAALQPGQARWRLRGTEIVIHRMESGERKGEWLFTPDTVARAETFWQRVKELPYLDGSGMGTGATETWADRNLPAWMRREVLGFSTWQWLVLWGALAVSLLIRRIIRGIAATVQVLTSRTEATWDDLLVEHLSAPAALLGASGIWYLAIGLLGLDGGLLTVVTVLIKGMFFAAIAFAAYRLMTVVWVLIERRTGLPDRIGPQLTRLLGQLVRVFAILIVGIAAAQNLGLDVASLIAGLGIGGLAFALAAQDTLSNLFASVMIMIDRPFAVGQFIKAKGVEGTVEEIGLRTTRLRTPAGSVVTIPNGELVKDVVDNLGVRPWRRVVQVLGIEYGTPPDRLTAFTAALRQAILDHPLTRKDELYATFDNFGPCTLEVRIILFIQTSSYTEELSAKQELFLAFMQAAERCGVRFAYPTQTVHLAR